MGLTEVTTNATDTTDTTNHNYHFVSVGSVDCRCPAVAVDSFLRIVVRCGYVTRCCYKSFADIFTETDKRFLKCFNAQTLFT